MNSERWWHPDHYVFQRESYCAGFWRAIVSSEFLISIAAYLVLGRIWDDAVIGVEGGQEGRSALGRMAELPEGLVFLPVLTGGSWTSD